MKLVSQAKRLGTWIKILINLLKLFPVFCQIMLTQLFFSFLILVTVAFNSCGQILLKMGAGQNPLNIYLLSGLVFYGLGTIFYITVLGKYNLSTAYPVIIGLTIIATMVSGAIILKEKVLISQWVGMGLMLSGIAAIILAKSN